MLRQLGQDLFAPPNVKGWDGGVTWITTNTLLTRYNDAAMLVHGTVPPLTAQRFRAPRAGGTAARKRADAPKPPPGRRKRGKNSHARWNSRTEERYWWPRWNTGLLQAPLNGEQEQTLSEFLDAENPIDPR